MLTERNDDDNTILVPHLDAAFGLSTQCQVNLDPIVVAVACFLRLDRRKADQGVTANEFVEKGSAWFPQRKVHVLKQEIDRMARFARTYPSVFIIDDTSETISLKQEALSMGDPSPCDEAWYIIALHRLASHNASEVNEALNDIEAVQRAYFVMQDTTLRTSGTAGTPFKGVVQTISPTEISVKSLVDTLNATHLE